MQIERQKNDMRSVDLRGFNVKQTEMHPKSEELLKFCKSVVGVDFKSIDADLVESYLYTYPHMNNMNISSCCMVFIVAGFFSAIEIGNRQQF